MPYYCFKCPNCGQLLEKKSRELVPCPVCGIMVKRDYPAESPISNFHPTRDLYAIRGRNRKRKGE